MYYYRLYSLNPSGRIAGPAREILAANDDEALLAAGDPADPEGFELWQEARRIAKKSPSAQWVRETAAE